MNNTRIGNKEAIALLVTITFNLIILNVAKSIINLTSSASLLNILYISIIVICYTCLICYFLKKFPTFDIIDISDYLGGNILKWIIGIAYIIYFVFWSGILLHLFSSFLQIIYFPMSKLFYIILIFLISAVLSCSMKHNAIYRSIFIFFPFLIVSTLILFLADIPYYEVDKIYPIFGNGLFTTFISGLANIFAFQTLAYIYFMPPILKKPEDIKKVSVTAIILSAIFLLLSVSTILFMFSGFVETDELLPLYSATKYVKFGSFFRKPDSIYLLIWIIAFMSYLGITLKFSTNILKKITHFKSANFLSFLIAICIFCVSLWPKNYAISTYYSNIVYKYSFFTLVIGISFIVLLFATLKKAIRRWLSRAKTH